MIRATIQLHTARYTLGNGDGRTRPVEIAIVRRQRQAGNGKWKTTRTTRVDAGAATAHTARQTALGISSLVVDQPAVDHGDLGTFDLAVDSEREAMLAAVRTIGSDVSQRLPQYELTQADPRGAVCVAP